MSANEISAKMGLLPKTKELAVKLLDQTFSLGKFAAPPEIKNVAVTILFIAAKVSLPVRR